MKFKVTFVATHASGSFIKKIEFFNTEYEAFMWYIDAYDAICYNWGDKIIICDYSIEKIGA